MMSENILETTGNVRNIVDIFKYKKVYFCLFSHVSTG